jgi:hypothetical protein
MPRNRLGYVNRSALIGKELSKELSMTASYPSRAPSSEMSLQSARARESIATCRPMSHQNSGDHGHEMHPQQFVRLVGCHEDHAPPHREAKLH